MFLGHCEGEWGGGEGGGERNDLGLDFFLS